MGYVMNNKYPWIYSQILYPSNSGIQMYTPFIQFLSFGGYKTYFKKTEWSGLRCRDSFPSFLPHFLPLFPSLSSIFLSPHSLPALCLGITPRSHSTGHSIDLLRAKHGLNPLILSLLYPSTNTCIGSSSREMDRPWVPFMGPFNLSIHPIWHGITQFHTPMYLLNVAAHFFLPSFHLILCFSFIYSFIYSP